jgi:protein ImuA
MAYPAQVEALVQKGWLWQGQEVPANKAEQQFSSSGWAELDTRLGGGWLRGSVNELQVRQPFIGELALLLPVLSQATTTALWVNPPVQPYAPGLCYQKLALSQHVIVHETDEKLALWTAEQALHSDAVNIVLMWHGGLSATAVRRLQQAAEAKQKLAFVITPWQQQEEARAYVTRLQLERSDSLAVRVLKRRFGWPLPPFPCGVDSRLPRRRRAL